MKHQSVFSWKIQKIVMNLSSTEMKDLVQIKLGSIVQLVSSQTQSNLGDRKFESQLSHITFVRFTMK